MRPRPADLAVSSPRVQLTHKTEPLELRIENTAIKKSLYLLPVPQFHAIVGMLFFIEYEVDLAGLESGIIEVNGSKAPMIEGDVDTNLKRSPENMETSIIEMISRRGLRRSSNVIRLRSFI